jgi:hypothetical protein
MRVGILLLGFLIAISPAAAISTRGSHGRSSGYHPRSYSRPYTSHSYRTRSYSSSYRSHSYRTRSYSTHARTTTRSYKPRSTYTHGVQRDSHGRIKRSTAAKNAFKRQHPCPSTGRSSGACPGYIIDHVKALECGGADDPSNMQWQTVSAAKAKDKTERHCR